MYFVCVCVFFSCVDIIWRAQRICWSGGSWCSMSLCMFLCMYIHWRSVWQAYLPMYIPTYVCSYVCTYLCMFLCMYLPMYVPMSIKKFDLELSQLHRFIFHKDVLFTPVIQRISRRRFDHLPFLNARYKSTSSQMPDSARPISLRWVVSRRVSWLYTRDGSRSALYPDKWSFRLSTQSTKITGQPKRPKEQALCHPGPTPSQVRGEATSRGDQDDDA